ncbi:NADH dehydrogenase [ubiquinone] 1 alpha subcomplex subunit 6 [Lingula anatina]|uniref:NADH dehydrogenase [ubiquinone] 1 alpha subcomplex subunit 6 n=1 Tax=Lingula anatina TaxID=7574 RepID=A0A1S3IWN1_LINAN|nr:NADH dehydrogenase [ubiquinone] 1 alpha subcomplex subunit 6 [Lingula anatina]|eukprot:XP_013402376.1 NADH dehydrogenase [ubiquinone] 1 alpha subcomplex subunit 6 [Lingula anatina]
MASKKVGSAVSAHVFQSGIKIAKPVVSRDNLEVKQRVLQTFTAWYIAIPRFLTTANFDATVPQARQILKEEFRKNKDVTDLRVIDTLLIQAQQQFDDLHNVYSQHYHIKQYFRKQDKRDFLQKFYDGDNK